MLADPKQHQLLFRLSAVAPADVIPLGNRINFVLWFSIGFSCQADNYKIPAQQQAVNVKRNNKLSTTGLFDLFKNDYNRDQSQQYSLKLQGPKYLRDHLAAPTTDIVDNFKIKHPNIQWIGQLISSRQNRRFQIKYFGDLMNGETIIDADNVVQQLIALDLDSGEEILLFDKMLHGWDGFICNAHQDQVNVYRQADKLYKSKYNTDNFKIIILAFYNNGTRAELLESATPGRKVQLENGLTLNVQDAFDDAFDAITIYAIDDQENKIKLVNEELA